jgi:hypothetical protein
MSKTNPFAVCHYGAYYSADGNAPYYCRECIMNLKDRPFASEDDVQQHMVQDHQFKVGFGLFNAGPKYAFSHFTPQKVKTYHAEELEIIRGTET